MTFAALLLLALTRAEIVQRMRAPVITQSEGLVRVYADCPEDVRREFQHPVASFASDTAVAMYRSLSMKPLRFTSPGVIVHIGDVLTNDTRVVSKVSESDGRTVTRIYLRNPATADVERFRIEMVKAFMRSVKGRELTDAEAAAAYRRTDPRLRIADDRERLERWLAGKPGLDGRAEKDEDMIVMMRKVLEPGYASRRDVLTFASRLFLYPRSFDEKFAGGHDVLSFRDAVKFASVDPRVRFLALFKANEMPVFGGGRGEALSAAAERYAAFLRELAKGERTEEDLLRMLDDADAALSVALEQALPYGLS